MIAGLILLAIAVLNYTEVWPLSFTVFEVVSIGSKLTGLISGVLGLIFLIAGIAGGNGKWVKWVVIAVAVVVLIVALARDEESNKDLSAELAGTYSVTLVDTEEQALILLNNIEAYEEETALADLTSLKEVKTVWFGSQGSYTFGYDIEATKACVREFYRQYFAALYAGRTALNEVYETNLDDMSDTAFYQYIAEMYGRADYEALLNDLTESSYNYNDLKVPYETGTYRIKDGKIYLTITGEDEETYVEYTLEEGTLTLGFSDEDIVYKKVN